MIYNVMNLRKTFTVVLLLILNLTMNAQDQQAPKFSIGDKAPALQYGTWLKGKPVKNYEKGRLYLFEFWATWCGPCIASMPHLSEFARAHKNEATVIAVNIWEKTGDKPYESSLPKVSKFVKSMGNKMDFNVITDTKNQFMGNEWMKAAGQGGIPCTFIVKDGVILWIGHPIELDSIVKVVNSKDYDVAATRKVIDERNRKSDSAMAGFTKIYKSYETAIAEKKYDEAIRLLESGMGVDSNMDGTLGFFKFQTLIEHYSEEKAMAYAREWQKTKPGYVGSTGAIISQKAGLSKETYLYAIELLKTLLDTPQPPSLIYKMIAQAYANMGDYKTAVETQEKSVTDAKKSLKEGKFAGFVTEETVSEGEKTLAEYKKKLTK
ncbi:MAG TPA: TlpA disulfide reductase family protein [Niastella sp.]